MARSFGPFALTLTLTLVIGSSTMACAAASEDEETEAADDALTSRQLPNVAAIRLSKVPNLSQGVTVASKKKVASVMKAIKVLRPSTPVRTCSLDTPTTYVKMLGPEGETVATGSYRCGVGQIVRTSDDKQIQISVADQGAVDRVAAEPLTAADVTFGADYIELTRPGLPGKKPLIAKEDFDAALDAVDFDAFRANAPMPRCVPNQSMLFRKEGKDVGRLNIFSCGDKGYFLGAGAVSAVKGAVSVDAAEVERIFQGVAEAR